MPTILTLIVSRTDYNLPQIVEGFFVDKEKIQYLNILTFLFFERSFLFFDDLKILKNKNL